MKSFPLSYAAIALVIALAAGVWLVPIPDAIPSTYAAALAVTVGAALVILMAWRNARPTDTVGQLLQRTESDDRAGRARSGR